MTISKNADSDGGAIAIRGFLFQFDKTILEALSNKHKIINFECRQDIDFDDFVIQVKHHAAVTFSPSRVRAPVLQLLRLFESDRSLKTILYCHFRDRTPSDWVLKRDELLSIVGKAATKTISEEIKNGFVANFKIRFTHDYEAQFEALVRNIESAFSVSKQEAILYHSIFQSKLLIKSTGYKAQRQTSFSDLKNILENAEVSIFNSAYSKYLTVEDYLKQIKKAYFTFKAPNIEKFERLFIIEASAATSADSLELIGKIAKKYYRKDKSPQPYVCIRGIGEDEITKIKRDLFDCDVRFFDGTYFNGDAFRRDNFFAKAIQDDCFSIKIVPEVELENLLTAIKVKEVYQFHKSGSLANIGSLSCIRHIKVQFQEFKQIISML